MDENRTSDYEPGTVIIRSHGVTRAVEEDLKSKGHNVIDATCPFVKKIHRAVDEHSKNGEFIVIIGNPDHPEVRGIVGWINGDAYTVISDEKDAENFSVNSDIDVCIVSQTTFNHNKFQELVEIINQKGYHIIVLNTICDATNKRQVEAADIASSVDAMLVIGSKNSSNTQKLYEICKTRCNNTYYIQTADDFQPSDLSSIESVGITAGASTPNNIIEEVQKKCQK
jgi:4-hydroxy-3-methylbut-2-enyl diphosphate reductase